MIDKIGGRYYAICDTCGEALPPRGCVDFYDTVDYKKKEGYQSRNSGGKWYDTCPGCLEEEKQEIAKRKAELERLAREQRLKKKQQKQQSGIKRSPVTPNNERTKGLTNDDISLFLSGFCPDCNGGLIVSSEKVNTKVEVVCRKCKTKFNVGHIERVLK